MSRFDDRTFENLQREMLDDYKSDMKTDVQEGSLVSVSIAKQAVRLEEAYNNLSSLDDNALVDTMDRDHLERWGQQVGLPIDAGDYAIVRCRFNIKVEVGTEYTASDSDYIFIITEYIGETSVNGKTYYLYNAESEDVGTDAGGYRGDIEPVDDIPDGFEEAAVTETVYAGKNEEETEDYRDRLLEAFYERDCAGNKAYYIKLCKAFDGIAATKVKRRQENDEYINLYVLADGYTIPSSDLLNNLKEYLDPSENEGQGLGEAPICHKVKVNPAVARKIKVSMQIEFETGSSYEGLKDEIKNAVNTYLTNLKSKWQDSDKLVVRISGIEGEVIKISGIVDAMNCQINGSSGNLVLNEFEVPDLESLEVI